MVESVNVDSWIWWIAVFWVVYILQWIFGKEYCLYHNRCFITCLNWKIWQICSLNGLSVCLDGCFQQDTHCTVWPIITKPDPNIHIYVKFWNCHNSVNFLGRRSIKSWKYRKFKMAYWISGDIYDENFCRTSKFRHFPNFLTFNIAPIRH